MTCIERSFPAFGPRFGLLLGAQGRQRWSPEVDLAEADLYSLRFQLVTSNSRQLNSNPDKESHLLSGVYAKKVLSAWAEVSIATWPSTERFWLPGGSRSGQIFEFLAILVGAGDINSSTSTPKYCDEPYGDLGMYVNNVRSAWTEVSIAT